MAAPAVIEPIMQKDGSDCVLASVSMVLGLPYVQVSAMALELWPAPHKTGLTVRETQRLTKHLTGHYMQSVPTKGLTIEEETGILFVKLPDGYHAVVLFEGVLVNPADGLIWNPHAYLATVKGHPIRLLRP